VTEKSKPTYDLEAIKAVFATVEGLRATGSALRGAAALGCGRRDMIAVIKSIERRHFRKSMTFYADHRVWQDVYHVPSEYGELYVKFTADAVAEFLLLSFKERGRG
jgi:motility quorum-sensing regulator/GCU-specific mRNA interferase toxin